jgi:hypothetical protein
MHSILEDDQFWKLLKKVTSLSGPVSTKELLIEFDVTENYLYKVINFLNDLQFPIEIKDQVHSTMLYPPSESEKPQFKMNFGLYEWLLFQAHFPLLEMPEKKFHHNEFQNTLEQYENKFNESDLYKSLELLHSIHPQTVLQGPLTLVPLHQSEGAGIVEQIEKAITEVKQLKLKYAQNKAFHDFVPYKLIHLEGQLSLFGEDLHDQCLSQIPLSDVVASEFVDIVCEHKYSIKEINDFIENLRSMNESQVRLILKVFADKSFDITPAHLHMGNPCVVTNGDGDRIWAAYVEPCIALFEWIFLNIESIEIIEPTELKKQYLAYCEEQLSKLSA